MSAPAGLLREAQGPGRGPGADCTAEASPHWVQSGAVTRHGLVAAAPTRPRAVALAGEAKACPWGGGAPPALPGPQQEATTSARNPVEVTRWISYTLLCVHTSSFITRGSRGPANLAMALGKEASHTV